MAANGHVGVLAIDSNRPPKSDTWSPWLIQTVVRSGTPAEQVRPVSDRQLGPPELLVIQRV